MADRVEITEILRGRLLRGLQGGALQAGDRLPSAREIGGEFGVDYRMALDAYRALADEGLVELRPRGGIYIAECRNRSRVPLPSSVWLTELLAQGVAREIPLTELHEWVRRSVTTLRLRALTIHGSRDQLEALCRELGDDYGLEVTGMLASELDAAAESTGLQAADVLVTTPALEADVRAHGERLGKPVVLAEVRPEQLTRDWRLLLGRPVFIVVHDERFERWLAESFDGIAGAENLRPLVVGRDDLDVIPDGAPVYVTRAARANLDGARIRGNILPAPRLLSPASSRAIIRFIVEANLDALATRRVW